MLNNKTKDAVVKCYLKSNPMFNVATSRNVYANVIIFDDTASRLTYFFKTFIHAQRAELNATHP